jgi:hypothetical protein
VSLIDRSRRIDIGLERLHDGLVHDGRVYFTTVNGQVAIADTTSLRVIEVIDLTRAHPQDMLLGWARGLMIEGDQMWLASRVSADQVPRERWLGVARAEA